MSESDHAQAGNRQSAAAQGVFGSVTFRFWLFVWLGIALAGGLFGLLVGLIVFVSGSAEEQGGARSLGPSSDSLLVFFLPESWPFPSSSSWRRRSGQAEWRGCELSWQSSRVERPDSFVRCLSRRISTALDSVQRFTVSRSLPSRRC